MFLVREHRRRSVFVDSSRHSETTGTGTNNENIEDYRIVVKLIPFTVLETL